MTAQRQLFTRVNRFQRPIIRIVIASSFVTIILAACAAYLYYDTTEIIIHPFKEISFLKITVLVLLMILPLAFYFVIVNAYRVSNRLLGPFERVLEELDTIIEKREKRHIQARQDDELAEEILKRVNTLIDRLP